ncbi:MAG: biotin transporter BioY [Planctomycetota bacterium]
MTPAPESITSDRIEVRQDSATLWRLLAVPGFALLTAVGAHIAFPMPPWGVPQSLQTLAVLLCALTLGPMLGMTSMLLYLIAGLVGVGVFANGESGWQSIIGQTGGYLVGFVACQPVARWIVRTPTGGYRGWLSVVVAGLAVHAVVFGFGVPWLYGVRATDPEAAALTVGDAMFHGCVVFLPGMVLKTGIATGLAFMFRPEIGRRIW